MHNQQNAQYAQLESFLNKYAKYAIGTNFSVELINGGKNQQGEYASGEANLDIQFAIAMAHNLDVRFYSVGGENHNFIPDLE
jgi:tripeptidyl-peptidase-1